MKNLTFALTMIAFSPTWALFGPNIRVDHENRPDYGCFHAAITIGQAGTLAQPLYVAIQDDSLQGFVTFRSDIYFQKSTDGGMTFLPEDILVKRGEAFACYPDITTDRAGNLYIVYTERLLGGSFGHIYCVRSTDQGNTWSAPSRVDDNLSTVMVGWARMAVDNANNLFIAWNDERLPFLHIWSSVSTDNGSTWRRNVRVDDDTISSDCFHPDVAVQPISNYYLVTATYPYYIRPNYISSHSMFTKSTDGGITFSPMINLDTFSYYCCQPHTVADRNYIICDYTGSNNGNQNQTQSRSSSDGGTNWNPAVSVTQLDTLYSSYYNGAKLAIDQAGRIHTALMVGDLVTWNYDIDYTSSFDYGVTWSERERVNDGATGIVVGDPDIAADSNGAAYVLWQDFRDVRSEIWFATNRPSAIAEQNSNSLNSFIRCVPTIFRDKTSFQLSGTGDQITTISIYNSAGSLVRNLALKPATRSIIWQGSDDFGLRCPPGIYIIKAERAGTTISTNKIVLLP
jgi:hypothetical protein